MNDPVEQSKLPARPNSGIRLPDRDVLFTEKLSIAAHIIHGAYKKDFGFFSRPDEYAVYRHDEVCQLAIKEANHVALLSIELISDSALRRDIENEFKARMGVIRQAVNELATDYIIRRFIDDLPPTNTDSTMTYDIASYGAKLIIRLREVGLHTVSFAIPPLTEWLLKDSGWERTTDTAKWLPVDASILEENELANRFLVAISKHWSFSGKRDSKIPMNRLGN